MPDPARRADHGFTLVEATIVLSVVVISFLTGLTLLGRGEGPRRSGPPQAFRQRRQGPRRPVGNVRRPRRDFHLAPRHGDAGPMGRVLANDIFSDRFVIPGVDAAPVHPNPTCAFHTRDDLTVFAAAARVRFRVPHGPARRIHHPREELARSDVGLPARWLGAQHVAEARRGEVLHRPRLESGTRSPRPPSGSPKSRRARLPVPVHDPQRPHGAASVRRLRRPTSLAPPVYLPPGCSRFAPPRRRCSISSTSAPTGSMNGRPRRQGPAHQRDFRRDQRDVHGRDLPGPSGDSGLEDLLLGRGSAAYPQAPLSRSGSTCRRGRPTSHVDHRDTAWSTGSRPHVHAHAAVPWSGDLTELAISTAVSHPYDATTNPTGVAEPNVVRVTVGTSESPKPNQWVDHIETFRIATRN